MLYVLINSPFLSIDIKLDLHMENNFLYLVLDILFRWELNNRLQRKN